MKAGTVSTYLQVVRAKRTAQAEKNVRGDVPAKSGKEVSARTEEHSLIRRGVRAAQRWPQERNVRVAELRSLVKVGRYQIDSKAIAECLLNNETRFV